MKNSTLISLMLLLVAVLTLSGCIYPYWSEDGGRHGGGRRGGGYGEGGHREGGERR